MNHEHEFDELARRKLAERDFPFQEAHWLDAQRAIAAQRRGRRGGALWIVGGAAVAIIAAWLLWPVNETPLLAELKEVRTAGPVEADAAGSGIVPQDAEADETMTNAVKGIEARSGTHTGATSPTTDDPASAAQLQRGARTQRDRAVDHPAVLAMPASRRTAVDATNADDRSVHVRDSRSTSGGVADKTDHDMLQGSSANVAQGDTVQGPPQPGGSLSEADAVTRAFDPIIGAAIVLDPVPDNTVVNDGPTGYGGRTTAGQDPPPELSANATGQGSDTVKDAPPALSTADQDSAGVDPTMDATAAHQVDPNAPPKDSTTIQPDPAPIVPPLITPRSPWELAALFGAFNTTSTYAGGNSDAWDVGAELTYGGGAELVHMGRNFGLGGGVHYGTYADRLRTPEEYRTVLNTAPSWFLQSVDTTILIVTGFDTATGFFTTQNVNVTINQLRMALDSSYANVLIREARERINRTSYVEAVGILDAHVVQGRWSFGVRGGPAFGLLTSRRGSIPGTGEADFAFEDMPMRSFVLGWTARAYVRYRLNSSLSVGIEPAVRGQLWESLEHQGVMRRSSAVGCMISLSYRLP